MRNVTISMDEDLVRRAKVEAARQDKSLSRFVAELVEREVGHSQAYQKAMESYLSRRPFIRRPTAETPYLKREELYDRPVLRRHERPSVSEGPVVTGEASTGD